MKGTLNSILKPKKKKKEKNAENEQQSEPKAIESPEQQQQKLFTALSPLRGRVLVVPRMLIALFTHSASIMRLPRLLQELTLLH